VFTWKTCEWFK